MNKSKNISCISDNIKRTFDFKSSKISSATSEYDDSFLIEYLNWGYGVLYNLILKNKIKTPKLRRIPLKTLDEYEIMYKIKLNFGSYEICKEEFSNEYFVIVEDSYYPLEVKKICHSELAKAAYLQIITHLYNQAIKRIKDNGGQKNGQEHQ